MISESSASAAIAVARVGTSSVFVHLRFAQLQIDVVLYQIEPACRVSSPAIQYQTNMMIY
jgi:hypothetical protein